MYTPQRKELEFRIARSRKTFNERKSNSEIQFRIFVEKKSVLIEMIAHFIEGRFPIFLF
jgi:hypothetical protein